MSIETSEAGVGIAHDALDLCAFLTGEGPKESLVAFIDGIIDLAKRAHAMAKETVDKFRSVRVGLNQVIMSTSSCSLAR